MWVATCHWCAYVQARASSCWCSAVQCASRMRQGFDRLVICISDMVIYHVHSDVGGGWDLWNVGLSLLISWGNISTREAVCRLRTKGSWFIDKMTLQDLGCRSLKITSLIYSRACVSCPEDWGTRNLRNVGAPHAEDSTVYDQWPANLKS
jgi:hypothetical protein